MRLAPRDAFCPNDTPEDVIETLCDEQTLAWNLEEFLAVKSKIDELCEDGEVQLGPVPEDFVTEGHVDGGGAPQEVAQTQYTATAGGILSSISNAFSPDRICNPGSRMADSEEGSSRQVLGTDPCLAEIVEILQRDNLSEKLAPSSSGIAEGDTVSGSSVDEKLRVLAAKLSHLTPELQQKFTAIFEEYADVWKEPQGGQMRTEAAFRATGAPVRMKQRALSEDMVAEFEKQIKDMLKKSVIRPSKSPWAAVPVFVRKKCGAWRMALDYRMLNGRLVFDAYPLPRLWDMVKGLAGQKYYTALDANWGFWNLPVAEDSKQFTAITTPWGLFEFNVLPFGIKNSPGEFQRAMDTALGHLDFVRCYIDDISYGDPDTDAHMEHLRQVLQACRDGGIFLKIEKAHICHPEIPVLGHLVSRAGVKPDPKKIENIRKLKAPASKNEVRSFIGAIQFLSKFCNNLADVTAPLVALTKKNSRFKWDQEHEESFEKAKGLLSEHVTLARFDPSKPVGLATDASGYGIGACLFQANDGIMVPLEFYSKKLTDAETRYDTREKEMLAIRRALEHFDSICVGCHTYVFTDHQSLQWMKGSDKGRIQRWSLWLQQYSLTMLYVPGKFNVIADWLSRNIDETAEAEEEIQRICVPEVWLTSQAGWWKAPEGFTPFVPSRDQLCEALEAEIKEGTLPVKETYLRASDKLWCYTKSNLLYVPASLREPFLHWFHASTFGGHRGMNPTWKRMRKLIMWPTMKSDIRDYIRACPCARLLPMINRSSTAIRGALEAPRPHELVSIDFIGPKDWLGKKHYVICLVDHATRHMVNSVSNSQSADVAIGALREYYAYFGAPKAVLHDQGPGFIAEKFVKFVKAELQAYNVTSSIYYPQGNGINESSHQAFNKALAALALNSAHGDFESAVRHCTMACNATPHPALGASPHFAMFGTELTLPGWQDLTEALDIKSKQSNLHACRMDAAVREVLRHHERANKLEEDTIPEIVKPGDWVRWKLGPYEKLSAAGSATITTTHKLQPRWSLPSKVLKVVDKCAIVQPLGSVFNTVRRAPLAHLRLLPTDLPRSLVHLNLENIAQERPIKAVEGSGYKPSKPVKVSDTMLFGAKGVLM